MNILEEILANRRSEVQSRKELYPVKLLERSTYFSSQTVSLKRYLARTDLSGVIAEIKRKSPSKGVLNRSISVEEISIGYMQAGASALSVLTEEKYFGGSSHDLTTARRFNFCPILRKDFVVDEYQIIEARSIGADVILLIAAALTPAQVRQFSSCAHSLGLEVLLELHDRAELERYPLDQVDVVGINNRDLKTFVTDIGRSLELGAALPPTLPKISESGIESPAAACALKRAGFSGFLIGEAFMRHSRPEHACAEFIRELRQLMAAPSAQ